MQEKLENIKYFYWIVMAHCKKCWKFSEAKHNSSLLTCYILIGLNKVIIKKASIFSYSPLIFIFFWKKTLRLYKSVIKTCRTDHDTVNFQEDFDMVHWANCSFSAITCEIAAKEIKVNWFSLLKARRAFKNYVNKWLSGGPIRICSKNFTHCLDVNLNDQKTSHFYWCIPSMLETYLISE